MEEKKQVRLQKLRQKQAKKQQNRSQLRSDRHQKADIQKIVTIGASVVLVLAHVAILFAIIASWRYYSIYPSLFGSIVAIVLCSMIIIDIVFFVGFNNKDTALKVISSMMAILLLIGGTIGSAYIAKANSIVNNVLDDGKSDKYETFSGVFVYYKDNPKHYTFSSLKDLNGKKVGMLLESSNGLTYIAKNILSKEKIDYATVDYKTNAEMMQGLLDGDVDAIVITSAYRTIYKGVEETPGEETTEDVEDETTLEDLENVVDSLLGETEEDTEGTEEDTNTEETAMGTVEESPFTKYLPDLVDFYSFEEELKTDTQKTNKNLSTDPFNVLLIGYSRTDIGSPVGLADSIILATINPQTYEVSMTSIARDSFVPIACYGGERDKINSGRSTSRACFIETVENFMNMDIDYYMELDYLGLVQIVNVIGGIYINNPVSFTLDGIYVPAGEHVFADGQMALQFCRERHHMPNGDFDRQQHQKEVIIEIAKAFIESGSVSLALKAMEEASDWMSTDLTLSQLTGVFNLLLNTKNYTGLDTFDLVDFQNTRITGSGGLMYYSYSMRLPLWVYLIYQGSYDESVEHINNVMGNYKTYNQTKNFTFSLDDKYVRPDLVSTDYEAKFMFEPDPMPAYWATLEGMTQNEALAWAKSKGVSLSVNTIKSGDAGYDSAYEGLVVSQYPRYGNLVSEYPSGSITVMGPAKLDPNKQVPDFREHNYSQAVTWAKEHGVPYSIDFDTSVSGKVGDVVSQTPEAGTAIERVEKLRLVVKAGVQEVKFNSNGHGNAPSSITTKTGDSAVTFPSMSPYEIVEGNFKYTFAGWYTSAEGGTKVNNTDEFGNGTVYAHWTKSCDSHQMGEWATVEEKTCSHGTKQERKCQNCDYTEYQELNDKLDHNWGEWQTVETANCDHGTIQSRTCKDCGEPDSQTLDDIVTGSACSTGSNTVVDG